MARQPARKRMYRTMQGRMVDIDKIRSANLETPAVGNMGVNARGDVLGPRGIIVKPKEQLMKEYYQTPKGMAQDTPMAKSIRTEPQPTVQQIQKINPIEQTKTVTPKTVKISKAKTESTEKKGIDAALDGLE
jgi:hypothetical protein